MNATILETKKEHDMTIQKLNPYIHLNGTTEKAIKLYESALGAKTENIMRYGNGKTVPPEHLALRRIGADGEGVRCARGRRQDHAPPSRHVLGKEAALATPLSGSVTEGVIYTDANPRSFINRHHSARPRAEGQKERSPARAEKS
jgi:hypothetical protein